MNPPSNEEFYSGFEQLISIRDIYRYALSQAKLNNCYSGHGSEDLFNDLWVLIAASLNISLSDAEYFLDARLTTQEKHNLAGILAKRILQAIPVPYLLNKAYLCGMEFYIDERALIPRSPIAELINNKFHPWINEEQVNNILDLCTGSGCLAICAAYAFPSSHVDAVDISKAALEVALINKNKHLLGDELKLIESDLWQQLTPKKYDIIISNPPYVSSIEMLGLPKEYSHEPKLALETSDNGLKIITEILINAKHYLNKHGILIVEVGSAMDALITKYHQVPFTWLEFEKGGEGVFLLTYEDVVKFF